jgi:hypothetical protein
MHSIREMQPWEKTRNQQARFLRSEWAQSPGWSFTVSTGFAPIVPMGIAAYATREYDVGVTLLSAAGGYALGLLALWVGSWVVFALRGPTQALAASTTRIEALGTEASAMAAQRDEAIEQREEALQRAEAAQRGSVTVQHHHHYYEGGGGPSFEKGKEGEADG